MMRFPKAVQTALDNTLAKADPSAVCRPLYNLDWVFGDCIMSLVAFTVGATVIVSKLDKNKKHIEGTQRQYHYNVQEGGSIDYYVSTHHRNPEVVC